MSKDTFAIQSGGPRLLSWYRNWDHLYTITGSTPRHGYGGRGVIENERSWDSEQGSGALNSAEYDALVIVGADNVQYLTGAPLPFAPYRTGQYALVSWLKAGGPACICPAEWEASIRGQGWVNDVRPHPAAVTARCPPCIGWRSISHSR